jgi:UDP-3-O-[3-hydroxymyristoyl] glucosamine N-acyltransferase
LFYRDNVVIGDNVTILLGLRFMSKIIGNNCAIHSGSVIGADGFGFAPNPDGTLKNSSNRECNYRR